VNRLTATLRSLYAEILKFGAVGTVGVLADVSTSNMLWHSTGLTPTKAAIGGTCVATVTAYIGNRYWTFRDRPDENRRREMMLFTLISLVGLIIENGFVYVSDHVLGFHGLLANNVAKFGLGLPVAGVFRFWTSHVLVFPEAQAHGRPHAQSEGGAVPHAGSGAADADADAIPIENGANTSGH
jgi:putative flippase GtrA